MCINRGKHIFCMTNLTTIEVGEHIEKVFFIIKKLD